MPRAGDVMIMKSTPPSSTWRTSPPRSRPSTSPASSRSATPRSASCAAAAPRAASPRSTGRWARRLVARSSRSPTPLKSNEMAQVVFEPAQPLVVDSFKNCEGLSRIAFLDGQHRRHARQGHQGHPQGLGRNHPAAGALHTAAGRTGSPQVMHGGRLACGVTMRWRFRRRPVWLLRGRGRRFGVVVAWLQGLRMALWEVLLYLLRKHAYSLRGGGRALRRPLLAASRSSLAIWARCKFIHRLSEFLDLHT